MSNDLVDIFSDDAFSLISMTAAINNVDHVPGRAGELAFTGVAQGAATTTVAIESKASALSLIQTSARGAPAPRGDIDKANLRHVEIPQIKMEDTVQAHSIQNVRAFGTNEASGAATHGKKKSTFQEKIDFRKLLSAQFPLASLRVVYSKSGTNPTAAVVRDTNLILDHKLYWISVETEAEASYLAAILNSETTRERASKWQSEGQFGKRDFDKAVFNLPIPKFDPRLSLHSSLASAGTRAINLVQQIAAPNAGHFTTFRKTVRKTLTEDGVAQEVDRLVASLLDAA